MVNAIDFASDQANPKKTNDFQSTGFVRAPNARQKNIGYNKVQLRYGYGSPLPQRKGASSLNPIIPRKVVEIRSTDLSDGEESSEEEIVAKPKARATEGT